MARLSVFRQPWKGGVYGVLKHLRHVVTIFVWLWVFSGHNLLSPPVPWMSCNTDPVSTRTLSYAVFGPKGEVVRLGLELHQQTGKLLRPGTNFADTAMISGRSRNVSYWVYNKQRMFLPEMGNCMVSASYIRNCTATNVPESVRYRQKVLSLF